MGRTLQKRSRHYCTFIRSFHGCCGGNDDQSPKAQGWHATRFPRVVPTKESNRGRVRLSSYLRRSVALLPYMRPTLDHRSGDCGARSAADQSIICGCITYGAVRSRSEQSSCAWTGNDRIHRRSFLSRCDARRLIRSEIFLYRCNKRSGSRACRPLIFVDYVLISLSFSLVSHSARSQSHVFELRTSFRCLCVSSL